jgi:hypothetical protein
MFILLLYHWVDISVSELLAPDGYHWVDISVSELLAPTVILVLIIRMYLHYL